MAQSDGERPVVLAARSERDDSRFTRVLGAGRPVRPREYRHTGAWWTLGVALALLAAGIVVADGPLIAIGLILAGIGAQLREPHRARPGRGGRQAR
ncbi:DUF3040 domain-containing protein [Streptomyces sp. NPDC002309]